MSKLLPNGSDICQCTACYEVFNSTHAFDKHRTGSFKKDRRKCLPIEEMREKGMSKNKKGRWITKEYLSDVGATENQETSPLIYF